MQQSLRKSWLGVLCALVVLVLSLSQPPNARAAGTSPAPPKQVPPPEMPAPVGKPADAVAPGRAEAEKVYAKGWEMSEEAKKEDASGKSDAAKKRFAKALKKFAEATEIDPTYYQAWNMVGYCSRKSGDLKRAFEAYNKCLAIEPEYAEAHEYLGEAFLMKGDLASAKEQLAWLRSRKSDEAEELAEKIVAYEKGGAAAVEKVATGEKEGEEKAEAGKAEEAKAEKEAK